MAAFDFPPSPTPGTVANGYTWNGTAWTLTSAAGGDVFGPAGAVADRVAIFSGTSGKLIADGGKTIAEIGGGVFDNVLSGLGLANNAADAANDIDIAPGVAADNTNVATMRLSAAMTKRLDAAWAAGTNAGGLDTGTVGNGSYHVWLIARSDTGAVDVLLSLSASAPTMPAAAWNRKRRIGSIVRTGGVIKAFVQDGNRFAWFTPVADLFNATNYGTARVSQAVTIPSGIRVEAFGTMQLNVTANTGMVVTDLATGDRDPSTSVGMMMFCLAANSNAAQWSAMSNAAAQVGVRVSISSATIYVTLVTAGYIDTRGQ